MDSIAVQHERPVQQLRRSFLLGLCWNLAVFALLSSLLWGLGYGSWYAVALSFVAPPVAAVRFTGSADVDMALLSWFATVLAGGFVFAATLKPRRVLTVLAHVSLGIYWLWSCAVIGIGV